MVAFYDSSGDDIQIETFNGRHVGGRVERLEGAMGYQSWRGRVEYIPRCRFSKHNDQKYLFYRYTEPLSSTTCIHPTLAACDKLTPGMQ